jgi:glycosyltransferase involved in cell wall biosynthesis
MLKLSIITINLNDTMGVQKTIESVINQTYKDYEHIIIDGGSTDGSVEAIQKYKNNRLKWISEKDTGIYNAMNKGILKSSGEYLLFLNSGDFLYSPHVLENVFNNKSDADLICCSLKIELLDKNESIIESIKNNKITNRYMFYQSLLHPSTLIKRELFVKFGLYDESFKIAGDYEFFVRLIKNKAKYIIKPFVLSVFNNQGISWSQLELVSNENRKIRKRYFYFSSYLYNIFDMIRKFFRKFSLKIKLLSISK